MLRPRRNRLVIGCGRECKSALHADEFWYSVDNSDRNNPELVKRLSLLTKEDFKVNHEYRKFKMILLEQVNELPKLSTLKDIMDDGGVIIFFGTQPEKWEEYLNIGFDIKTYFSVGNKTFIFMKNADLVRALEIINFQLKPKKNISSIQTEFQNLIKIYMELADESKLPPLLLSVLAHCQMYVELRTKREVNFSLPFFGVDISLPTRNVLRDGDYERFIDDFKKVLYGYAEKNILLSTVMTFIESKKEELLSSAYDPQTLDHTTLRQILDTAKEAINYYHKRLQLEEDCRPQGMKP